MDDHKKLHYHIVTRKICMQKRVDAISCPRIGSIVRTEKRCIYSYLSFFKVDQKIQMRITQNSSRDACLKLISVRAVTRQMFYMHGRYVKLHLCTLSSVTLYQRFLYPCVLP